MTVSKKEREEKRGKRGRVSRDLAVGLIVLAGAGRPSVGPSDTVARPCHNCCVRRPLAAAADLAPTLRKHANLLATSSALQTRQRFPLGRQASRPAIVPGTRPKPPAAVRQTNLWVDGREGAQP